MNVQVFRTSFHGSVFLLYLAAIVKYELLPPMPLKRSHEHFAGRLKYLTYWNLWMQLIYFGFCTYLDRQTKKSLTNPKALQLRDKFYSSIALPYGLFVFAVFWILYAIDREFIFPRALDAIFPPWLNHVSHTIIVPVLLIDTWMLKHYHPRRKEGLKITILFGTVYISWVLFLALVMDIWPYPILQILNWGMRFVFFGVCILFLVATYILGEKINKLVWG